MGLAPVAAFGPTMSLALTEYISVAAVTAAYGSALTAAHFWRDPKVSKRSSPQHSAPRLGSVCPHSGLTGRFEIKSRSAAALEPTGVGSGVLGKCGRGLAPDSGESVNPSITDPPSSGCRTVDIVYI